MDFPISVPSIGLVAGKFADEDPLVGTPGSLIPSVWGNAVTEEILAVIEAAGFVPDEENNTQMVEALKLIVRGGVTSLNATAVITKAQIGLLLLGASGSAATYTLPAADSALGVVEVVLRRTDISANDLIISAAGADKIMLDTSASTAGQASTELLFAGDYFRLRSDGAGKWWCVGQAQLPGSIASGLVSYAAAGVFTFAVPAVLRSGRRRPKVIVTAGGGSGGTGAAPNRGAGGAAGGTAIKRVDLTGIAAVTCTVGAGGAFGALTGGASSFGAFCSATGGAPGGVYSGSVAAGGAPGIGVGGDINLPGGYGSDSPVQGGSGTGGSGDGGSSYWGGGSRSGSSAGITALCPGSGAGGSETSTTAAAAGIIRIEW